MAFQARARAGTGAGRLDGHAERAVERVAAPEAAGARGAWPAGRRQVRVHPPDRPLPRFAHAGMAARERAPTAACWLRMKARGAVGIAICKGRSGCLQGYEPRARPWSPAEHFRIENVVAACINAALKQGGLGVIIAAFGDMARAALPP